MRPSLSLQSGPGRHKRFGEQMMTATNHDSNRRILPARRLTLLGSVALVGAALAFGGAGTTGFTERAFAATTQQQGPVGFADLIARVKPAVISVRVKVDQTADASGSEQMNDEDLPPGVQGMPFEKFFRRHGF